MYILLFLNFISTRLTDIFSEAQTQNTSMTFSPSSTIKLFHTYAKSRLHVPISRQCCTICCACVQHIGGDYDHQALFALFNLGKVAYALIL